ncbi:MAG: lasso peptide biosynthesis B2 protein, partial [Desulfuromonadaceae bacterium]|nr:lasso peptide biosynthesis B2 protein [Desulfuromonadaceae bacterium]
QLGTVGLESDTAVSAAQDEIAQRTGWAVETMARHTPWQSRCLVQALSAWWMLSRRGVRGTVYFGVAAAETGAAFNAHAWLRCGSRIVTGGPNHESFRVLSYFSKGRS